MKNVYSKKQCVLPIIWYLYTIRIVRPNSCIQIRYLDYLNIEQYSVFGFFWHPKQYLGIQIPVRIVLQYLKLNVLYETNKNKQDICETLRKHNIKVKTKVFVELGQIALLCTMSVFFAYQTAVTLTCLLCTPYQVATCPAATRQGSSPRLRGPQFASYLYFIF